MTVDLQTIMAARLARRDIPRDERRIRIRVLSETDGLALCGVVIWFGENVVEIYESDLAEFRKLIENDRQGLILAEEDYRAHLAEVEEKKGATERPFRPSLAASFRHLRRRDPLPFRAVEVLSDEKSKPTKAA